MRRRRASCPSCGASPPRGAQFCPECGSRLAAAPEPTAAVEEQPPTAPEQRGAATALAGAVRAVRDRAGYAVEAFATRSRAGREVARIRAELLDLARDRERALKALGEAVYGDDAEGTTRLRDELTELDSRIERKEAEMATIAVEAQERIERARFEVKPTEMVEIPDPPTPSPPEPPGPGPEPGPPTPVPEPYPPPDEATPPEPARIPEPGPLGERTDEK